MYNQKIIFNGECVRATIEGEIYQFLILGDGIIPFGANKNIRATTLIRSYLKEHYAEELRKIKINQCLKETQIKG